MGWLRKRGPPPASPSVEGGEAGLEEPLQLLTDAVGSDGQRSEALSPGALVQRLLQDETEGGLNRIGADGWSCLHHAASLGLRGHVEALLDGGVPPSGGERQRAKTALRTQAPLGRFPKSLTALDIAEQVNKAGHSDRKQVIQILLLGAQAEGWGDWRQLQREDRQRGGSLGKGHSTSGSGRGPLKHSPGKGMRQSSVSEEEVQRRIVLAEDQVRWALRNELADSAGQLARAEMKCRETQQNLEQAQHQIERVTEQSRRQSQRAQNAEQERDSAKTAHSATEKAAAEFQRQLVAARSEIALAEDARDKLLALELRRQHSKAAGAISRMLKRGLARSLDAWRQFATERPRKRRLLARVSAKLSKASMVRCFDAWVDSCAASSRHAAETEAEREHHQQLAQAHEAIHDAQVALKLEREQHRSTSERVSVLSAELAASKNMAHAELEKFNSLKNIEELAQKQVANLQSQLEALQKEMSSLREHLKAARQEKELLMSGGKAERRAMAAAAERARLEEEAAAKRKLQQAEEEAERRLAQQRAEAAALSAELAAAQAAREADRLEADAERERLRLEAEAERNGLKGKLKQAQTEQRSRAALARQTAWYSRQLALTARQHARYVAEVGRVVEKTGGNVAEHLLDWRRISSTKPQNDVHNVVAKASEDTITMSVAKIAPEVAVSTNIQSPTQLTTAATESIEIREAPYSSNALAALEVLFAASATSNYSNFTALADSSYAGEDCEAEQAMVQLATRTLQHDIQCFLRHNQRAHSSDSSNSNASLLDWLHTSGLTVLDHHPVVYPKTSAKHMSSGLPPNRCRQNQEQQQRQEHKHIKNDVEVSMLQQNKVAESMESEVTDRSSSLGVREQVQQRSDDRQHEIARSQRLSTQPNTDSINLKAAKLRAMRDELAMLRAETSGKKLVSRNFVPPTHSVQKTRRRRRPQSASVASRSSLKMYAAHNAGVPIRAGQRRDRTHPAERLSYAKVVGPNTVVKHLRPQSAVR